MTVDTVGGDATATLVQMLSDRGVLVTYSAVAFERSASCGGAN